MLCRTCYREVLAGSAFCPRCGARQAEAPPVPAPSLRETPPPADAGLAAAPPVPAAGGNPWEELAARGFFPALGETLQQSIFHPAAFFRRTSPAGKVGSALVYAVLVGTLSAAVALLWQRVMGYHLMGDGRERLLPLLNSRAWSATLLALPLGIALWNVILSAILHVSLFVVGGARAGYGATLKAVAYSYSAMAFTVFPFCGAPIGVVWFVVVNMIGLRELHKISAGRAFWAWFLPFLIASCLAVVGAALLGAALGKWWYQFGGGRFDV